MNEIKDMFRNLEKQAMLKLDEEEMNDLLQDYQQMLQWVSCFQDIPTENIEPCLYPYDFIDERLREDQAVKPLPVQAVLQNAADSEDHYVKVARVVR